MPNSHALHQLAQRLDCEADRLGEIADLPARRIAAAAWDCPRGRRALLRAEELGAAARSDADVFRDAARALRDVARRGFGR